jgi:hypothetical protein
LFFDVRDIRFCGGPQSSDASRRRGTETRLEIGDWGHPLVSHPRNTGLEGIDDSARRTFETKRRHIDHEIEEVGSGVVQ